MRGKCGLRFNDTLRISLIINLIKLRGYDKFCIIMNIG